MNHQTIEESQTVERYLLNRLDEDERALFEEHYLSCPQCLADLEASAGLLRGFRRAAAEEGLKASLSQGAAVLLRRRWLGWAMGLVLLTGVAGFWLGGRVDSGGLANRFERTARSAAEGAAVSIPSLSPRRGSSVQNLPHVVLTTPGPELRDLVLALDIGVVEYDRYQVALLDPRTAEPFWSLHDVEPDRNAELTVLVPINLLPTGISQPIEAVVSSDRGAASEVEIARYSFYLRKARDDG